MKIMKVFTRPRKKKDSNKKGEGAENQSEINKRCTGKGNVTADKKKKRTERKGKRTLP